MTKAWEDVQERACQLYRSGRPLSRVRKIIEREYNFTASERAWRMKLKEWKLKRSKCLGDCSEHAQERSVKAPGPSINQLSSISDETSMSEQESLPQELPNEPFQQLGQQTLDLSRLDSLIFNNNGTDASYMIPLPPSLHELYLWLELDRSAPNVENILRDITFQASTESILHYAAARENSEILDSIIEFMQVKGLDLDMRNAKDQSSLELAIKANLHENVESLLKAGASPCSPQQWSKFPLLWALVYHAGWRIIKVLFEFGIDADLALYGERSLTTLLEAASRIDSEQTDAEAENQIETIHTLLVAGATYSWSDLSDRRAYECLLHHLKRYIRSTLDPSPTFMDSFRRSLENGIRIEYDTLYPCLECGCRNLTQLISFHFEPTGLPRILIDSINLELRGPHLVGNILAASCSDPKLRQGKLLRSIGFLKLLWAKGMEFTERCNPISITLSRSPDDHKVEFVRELLAFSDCNVHISDPIWGLPLVILPKVTESLRWELAEMILNADTSPPLTTPLLSIYDYKTAYMKYQEGSFRLFVATYLKRDPGTDSERLHECLRCIIHVITSRMINHTNQLGGLVESDIVRLRAALRMRQCYDLPDLALSPKLLLDVIRSNEQVSEDE